VFEDSSTDYSGDVQLAVVALMYASHAFSDQAAKQRKAMPGKINAAEDLRIEESADTYDARADLCFAMQHLIESPLFHGEIGGPNTHEIYGNIMYGIGLMAAQGQVDLDESLGKVQHMY